MLKKILFGSVICGSLGIFVTPFVFAESSSAETVDKAVSEVQEAAKISSRGSAKSCSAVSAANSDFTRLDQYMSDTLNKSFNCDTGLTFDGEGILLSTIAKQDEKGDKDKVNFVYDGEFNVHFLKKVSNVGFGIESCIKTRSGLIKGDRAIFDALYTYLESDLLGKFVLGWAGTAADSFTIGGNSICAAYGGPDSGNLDHFFNQSAGTIVGTGCPIDDGKALKIGWYTPTFKGFSLGITYTFNSRNAAPFKKKMCSENCSPAKGGEHVCWDYAHSSGYSKKIFTVAAQYEYGSDDSFNAKLAAGGWFGKGVAGESPIQGGVHNVRSWFIGTILGYKDLKMAFGYIDNGRSILDKYQIKTDADLEYDPGETYTSNTPGVGLRPGADAGKIYTCGISYKIQRLTSYAGYFHSVVKYSNKNEKAKADIITVGLEYKFNNLFSVFGEYNHLETKTCDRARIYAKVCGQGDGGKNRGNLYMVGLKVAF